jgi:hypothetical protein
MKSLGKHLQRLGVGAVLTGLAFSAGAGMASAQTWYNGPPPPPPRYERAPMRPGHVWQGGHWYRAGGRWVWAPGRWVAVARGHRWFPGHWVMGPRGRYWVDGRWG